MNHLLSSTSRPSRVNAISALSAILLLVLTSSFNLTLSADARSLTNVPLSLCHHCLGNRNYCPCSAFFSKSAYTNDEPGVFKSSHTEIGSRSRIEQIHIANTVSQRRTSGEAADSGGTNGDKKEGEGEGEEENEESSSSMTTTSGSSSHCAGSSCSSSEFVTSTTTPATQESEVIEIIEAVGASTTAALAGGGAAYAIGSSLGTSQGYEFNFDALDIDFGEIQTAPAPTPPPPPPSPPGASSPTEIQGDVTMGNAIQESPFVTETVGDVTTNDAGGFDLAGVEGGGLAGGGGAVSGMGEEGGMLFEVDDAKPSGDVVNTQFEVVRRRNKNENNQTQVVEIIGDYDRLEDVVDLFSMD